MSNTRPEIPRPREAVRWGCAEHRTPAGQPCQHCADQGELFARADARRRAAPLGEDCPGCGDTTGTYFVDSSPGADTWACPTCGAEWRVEIAERVGIPRAG